MSFSSPVRIENIGMVQRRVSVMGNGNTELIKTDRNNLLVRRRTMLIC